MVADMVFMRCPISPAGFNVHCTLFTKILRTAHGERWLLAGSRLDTGAKLEVIAMISGFATMYGAMQAGPASHPADAAGSAAAQVATLARAAASGRCPNLAAARATAEPPRSQDDIFDSCIERLTILPGLRTRRPTAVGDRTS
jgi:hypothetical protein